MLHAAWAKGLGAICLARFSTAVRPCSRPAAHQAAAMLAHTQVKQFDVDVHWMGRNRSAELKRFSAIPDPGQRLALLREAIQGGSITPEAMGALRPHMQVGRGWLEPGRGLRAGDTARHAWDDGLMVHAAMLCCAALGPHGAPPRPCRLPWLAG